MTIHLQRTLLLFLAFGLTIFSACSTKPEKEAISKNMDSPIVVKMSAPSVNEQHSIEASGQIEAAQTANISTRVMGYITKLNVKVGDHVSEGQVLGNISNQDILAKRAQSNAMVSEAEASLKNARKDYDRYTNLSQQQSASAKEVDNITLLYNAAQSRLEGAKQARNEINAMLEYTVLKAPFSGVITQKLTDAGSMATPGMSLLTIEQSGSYQVSASVAESEISGVNLGATAILTIKALNKRISGTVSQLNRSSQFSGGQYIIKVAIPANEKSGLYAGMYVNVTIPLKTVIVNKTGDDAVVVPVSSIVNKDQLTGLYTVSSNHTALLRWVRLGKMVGNKVEVLSGLNKNESFIVSAEGKLYNGAPVKVFGQ